MLALTLVLVAGGCLFIYGAGQSAGGRFTDYWFRQLCWIIIGAVCHLVLCGIDYERVGRWSWAFYALAVVLLIAVDVSGTTRNQHQSWLVLPILRITVQPAEFAKPATLLLAAWIASRPALRTAGRGHYLIPVLAVTALPVALIGLQPDWGTALVFLPMIFAVIFVAGIPLKWVAITGLILLLAAPIGYRSLHPYQRDRLLTLVQPGRDVMDSGWNAHQSLLAVGSGGLWGKGFRNGTQYILGFLPRTVGPTDFIFSVIAEEFGFVGAGALVCALFGVILCCLRTAALAPDEFGAFICIGVAALFFSHAFINVGMNVRIAPIIGIPLPFVSAGGSFMVSTMIAAGLVQSVHASRRDTDEG